MNAPRIHTPELDAATAWLNTTRPLTMKELRGQVVILDFWTHCCVNCMHVLPVLRDLEERHKADPLVVIGVHSAKFDAENDARHIRAAMERHGVAHAVAMDEKMELWSRFTVRSWPTLVIVRPDGTVAAIAPGEPEPAALEMFVQGVLDEARRDGTLAQRPFVVERPPQDDTGALSYPGKAIAALEGVRKGQLFVADSGHHRVLVLDAQGRVLDTIGSGLRGAVEGSFAECALDDPQGMALEGDALYIADARAHVIWKADLKARTLSALAGTGQLGAAPLKGTSPAKSTALRTPWDVALRGQELFVALAGSHQLALVQLDAGTIEPIAGDGREALIDGLGVSAALAQPSGLSLRGTWLFFADSESSGVRAVDLRERTVRSLAGGPGLFDFGDKTGELTDGMLQHPLDVLATEDGVIVADTYNDKLKRFSLHAPELEPFFTSADGITLDQPAGLSRLPDGDILVTDTNHHRLVRVGREGKSASVVTIQGAQAPQRGVAGVRLGGEATAQRPVNAAGWFTAIVELPAGAGLRLGGSTLSLSITAPKGFEFAEGAPYRAQLEVSRRSDLLSLGSELLTGKAAGGTTLALEVTAQATHAGDIDSEVLLQLDTVACDAVDHAACHPVKNHFRIPLRLLREGQASLAVSLPLEMSR